jgi:hypothetical protein
MKLRSLLAGLALLWMIAAVAAMETKEENYEDGKIKLKFSVDDAGKKQGTLIENYPNGKTKLKAVYKDDQLDGQVTEYTEKGKVRLTAHYKAGKLHGLYSELGDKGEKKLSANYKDGMLDGSYVRYEGGQPGLSVTFKADKLAFPRSEEQLTKKLLDIDPPGQKIEGEKGERDAALRRLKCYRYLCEVPYENLILDDEMNKLCLAGAQLCEKIGRLDHKPANPGLPEADYKLAFNGTSKSNLAMGMPTLPRAVDAWMDDSDPSNIERVGHRRWCISPRLLKTGFGRSGKFSAMYSLDQSQKSVPDYDGVAYPARGLMPVQFFNPRYAWILGLNPQKFRPMDGSVEAKIWEIDDTLAKMGEPLKMNYCKPGSGGFGLPNCLIFRPEKLDMTPGKRYLVEIDGVKRADGRTPAPIRYVVQFFRVKA